MPDVAIWANGRYALVTERRIRETGAMASPKASIENARASEERCRASLREVVMGASWERLRRRPPGARRNLRLSGKYGELSPFDMAVNAWNSGNRELYEHALADDARLTALSERARASG